MDATRDSHTEGSKSERERQIPYDITYIWNLIYSTNEPFHRRNSRTWRTVWRYLRNLYIELPHDPAIPLLGIYPDKTFLEKDTCIHMFIEALFTFTTAKTWKQPTCPSTDE